MLSTYNDFIKGCYQPKMTFIINSNVYFLLKMTSSVDAIFLRLLHQSMLSNEDDFINWCYLSKMTS